MQLASDEWTPTASLRARAVVSGMEVTTIGVLVLEDDDVVVPALSIDEAGGSVFGAHAIWKASILERRGLDQISVPRSGPCDQLVKRVIAGGPHNLCRQLPVGERGPGAACHESRRQAARGTGLSVV